MTIIAVKDNTTIVKHKESAAILSVDLNAYHQHMNKRKQQQTIEKKLSDLETRVAQLESIILCLNNINNQ